MGDLSVRFSLVANGELSGGKLLNVLVKDPDGLLCIVTHQELAHLNEKSQQKRIDLLIARVSELLNKNLDLVDERSYLERKLEQIQHVVNTPNPLKMVSGKVSREEVGPENVG